MITSEMMGAFTPHAQVGASVCHLYLLLRELDPNAVVVNCDLGHATVEGGLGASEVFAAMRRDLKQLRVYLAQAA